MKKSSSCMQQALITLMVVLALTVSINSGIQAKTFVVPSALAIDGAFTDWGTTASPASGVYVHRDFTNNGITDGSGFNGTPADLNYFWNALSTQLGGATPAGPTNLIQNIYYRIDTFTTSVIEPGQLYNIQLNLGVAGAGKADHLLQIWVKNTATPKVTLVLYSYNTPYPAIGAYTSGALTGRVSNVANPFPGYSGAVDTNAAGVTAKYDATHYGVEVKIPISWYGSTYGGLLKNDGTGSLTYYGAVFTSTGTLGAVGTVKDTMGDASGTPIYLIVDPVTGATYFENYNLVNVLATKVDSIYTDVLPTGASPSDILLYTVTVTNVGPNTARAVSFKDTITDPNLTWMDNVTTTTGTVTSGNSPGDNGCVVAIGNMLVDASVTITFRAQIKSTMPSETDKVSNQGLVSGSNFASVPTDDPASLLAKDATSTAVSPVDAIEPYKSWALTIDADHNGIAGPGDTLTYTVVIENEATHNVEGVTFTDIPDVNSTLVSGSVTTTLGTITQGNNSGDNAVAVDLGTIPGPDGQATVTFQVVVNNPLPFGVNQLSNQGFVSGAHIAVDPTDDPTDESYDNPTVTVLTAEPLIEAYKRYELTDDVNHDGLPGAGDNLTYFIDIINIGNQNATGVVFNDTIDTNTTLMVGSARTSQGIITSETGSGLAVDIGTVPGGHYTVNLSFKVKFNAGVTEGIYNQGTVSADDLPDVLTDDPNTHTMHDSTYTSIALGPAELRVSKSAILAVDADNNNVLSPGDTLQYIIAINNNGGSAADNISFTDTLDPNTTLVTGSTTASQSTAITETPTSITVDVGTLEGGAVHAICLIAFQVTINDPFPINTDAISNQGTVTADVISPVLTDDPNTDASPDATVSPVFADPLITATKGDSIFTDILPTGASPGDILRYTVIIGNSGTTVAHSTFFQDNLTDPYLVWMDNVTTTAGTILTGNSPGDDGCLVDIGDIAAGDFITITFRAQIKSTMPAGINRVANQGLVSGANFSSVVTDDLESVLTNDVTATGVSPVDSIEPYKSWELTVDADHNGIPGPGDVLTYTVVIENEANHDVEGVTFSDIPDANSTLEWGSVTTTQGSVSEGNSNSDNAVTVDLGTITGPDGDATVTFRVTINSPLPAGVTRLINQGFVTGPHIATDPTDDPTDESYDNPTITQLTAEPLIEAYKRYELSDDNDHDGLPGPGDNLTYFIDIMNKGNQEATGVVFSDTIDDNTTLILGSTISSQGSISAETADGVTVNIGTIPGGNYMVTISFKVSINPGLIPGLYNQGRVAADDLADVLTDDPNTHTVNDPTFTSIAQGPAELRVTKSAILAVDADNNNLFSPGDTLQYIIAINNNGGSAADNISFTDTIDPNTTLVENSTSVSQSATIIETPGSVSVEAGTLEGGAAHSICLITFQVTLNNPFTGTSDNISNQGTVSADGISPILTDDPNTDASPDATVSPVFTDPLITATKVDSIFTDISPTGASPGDILLYTVTIVNSGNATARSVTFQDTLVDPDLVWLDNVTAPDGTIVTGNSPGDNGCLVNFDNLSVGEPVIVTFRALINDSISATVDKVINQGLVSGSDFASLPTDDPATLLVNDPTATGVSPKDAIEPFKSWALTVDADHNGIPGPGDVLTYTVVIENEANHDVEGVTFSDIPDANSTLEWGSVTTTQGTVTEGNNNGDNAVTVDLGTITGPDGDATVTFRVTINSPLPAGVTRLINQGFVTGPHIATDPTDDPTDESYDNPTITQLTAEPLIEAYKRYELSDDNDHDGLPGPGDNLTYFIDIMNKGNQEASGVVFSDTIDDNTTLILGSTFTSQGSVITETADTLQILIGKIPGGNSTAKISFKVSIDPGAVDGLYNQGRVTAFSLVDVLTDDPNTHTINDPTYTALAGGPPELRVTKSVILAVDADGNSVLGPGDTLQYIIAINNNGGSAADNITFTDTLDPNTTLVENSTAVSQPAAIIETPGSVSVEAGTLEGGAAHSICLITFRVTVNNPLLVNTDTISNQGWVAAKDIDPIPTDDPYTDSSPDVTAADLVLINDLVITKTDSVDPVQPGNTLTYTIRVTNNGASPSNDVVVIDSYPAGFIYVSSEPVPDTGTDNQWTFSSIAAGSSETITITGTAPETTRFMTNTAAVTSSTSDPDSLNNTASQGTWVRHPRAVGGHIVPIDRIRVLIPWLVMVLVLTALGIALRRRGRIRG